MSNNGKVPYPHPGEILKEFIDSFGLNVFYLAKRIGEDASVVLDIVSCERSISVGTALRLSRFFKLSENYWLNLQTEYDIRKEKAKPEFNLNDIKPFFGEGNEPQ